MIIAFVQRYVARAGIGTLVSLMLPYSLTFLVGWSILFIAWLLLGWPVGPAHRRRSPSAARRPDAGDQPAAASARSKSTARRRVHAPW